MGGREFGLSRSGSKGGRWESSGRAARMAAAPRQRTQVARKWKRAAVSPSHKGVYRQRAWGLKRSNWNGELPLGGNVLEAHGTRGGGATGSAARAHLSCEMGACLRRVYMRSKRARFHRVAQGWASSSPHSRRFTTTWSMPNAATPATGGTVQHCKRQHGRRGASTNSRRRAQRGVTHVGVPKQR